MLVITRGSLVPLNDALRDAHEALADLVLEEIERREKSGIPLDDDTDFGAVAEMCDAAGDACEAQDTDAVREAATQILGRVTGGLRPLSPFEPNAEYEGVSVRMRAVSEGRRIATGEAVSAATSISERHAVLAEYVGEAICEIHGLEDEDGPVEFKGDDGLTPEQVATLDAAGMISDLWSAAKHFADLPASKKKHFGSRRRLTSQTSGAAPVASKPESGSDATAAPLLGTDSPTTSQTPAPAGMY